MYAIEEDTIDQIFEFMVRDLSKHALTLYGKASSTAHQMDYLSEDDPQAGDQAWIALRSVFSTGLPPQRRI